MFKIASVSDVVDDVRSTVRCGNDASLPIISALSLVRNPPGPAPRRRLAQGISGASSTIPHRIRDVSGPAFCHSYIGVTTEVGPVPRNLPGSAGRLHCVVNLVLQVICILVEIHHMHFTLAFIRQPKVHGGELPDISLAVNGLYRPPARAIRREFLYPSPDIVSAKFADKNIP